MSGLSGKSAKPDFSAHAQSLFDRAISFIDTPRRHWPIVQKLYRWVLRLGGGRYNYIAHYNLARNLHEHGKYEQAAEHYRRAIELKPDYYDAHNNFGIMLCLMGQYKESEAAFRRALEIEDYVSPHNNLADLYLRQGRLEEAETEVLIALELEPDCLECVHTYAQILAAQGRLDEAEERYRQVLDLAPEDIEVLGDFSEFLIRQQRPEEAASLSRRVRELKEAQKWKDAGLQEWRERSEVYFQRKRGKQSDVSQ